MIDCDSYEEIAAIVAACLALVLIPIRQWRFPKVVSLPVMIVFLVIALNFAVLTYLRSEVPPEYIPWTAAVAVLLGIFERIAGATLEMSVGAVIIWMYLKHADLRVVIPSAVGAGLLFYVLSLRGNCRRAMNLLAMRTILCVILSTATIALLVRFGVDLPLAGDSEGGVNATAVNCSASVTNVFIVCEPRCPFLLGEAGESSPRQTYWMIATAAIVAAVYFYLASTMEQESDILEQGTRGCCVRRRPRGWVRLPEVQPPGPPEAKTPAAAPV